jgi:hypothetical protein
MRVLCGVVLLLGGTTFAVQAQVSTFPYSEHFDSAAVPNLPAGWSTSTNRVTTGDFVTSTSTPRSAPNTVFSQNAQITQTLTSLVFDFSGRTPDRLSFYTARSGTHTAGLLVEASLDNGITFPVALSDTIRNPGTTSYVLTTIQLPPSLSGQSSVRFRWRLVGTPSGGTAGTFRFDDVSLTVQTAFDLAITRFQASPSAASPRDIITLNATVRNLGTQQASGYSIRFFRDANNNGIAESGEEFATQPGPSIPSGDSAIVSSQHGPLGSGVHRMMAVVIFAQDENRTNDTASTVVSVGADDLTMVVNEIMYDELAGQNEWVEFYQRGTSSIDLANWRFRDRPTAGGSINTFTITTQSRNVQPGAFVVVAADSTILFQFPHLTSSPPGVHLFILNRSGGLSLGNTGDDVVLLDFTGRTIDSVAYLPSWHHQDVFDSKGRSLERINPNIGSNDARNWSTSANARGGTPGQPNSIFATAPPTGATLSVSPNPFSPDGDGFEDFCIVRYNVPIATPTISVRIFDVKGRLIRTLANAEVGGPEGEIVWDGLEDTRQRARLGAYVVLLEAADAQTGAATAAKTVVVVATKF